MTTSYKLADDQIEIRDFVRRIAQEKIAPRAEAIDESQEYPTDIYELLCEVGLYALPFPEEYGGTNSVLKSCLAMEELARVCYTTTNMLVVQWVPIGAILYAGTDDQKARYLPRLASGELRAAVSSTEPQSGSDLAGIKTRARRTDGGYLISGAKVWCTTGNIADIVVVAAKIENDSGDSQLSYFIVEKGSKGFTAGKKEPKMAARGLPTCPLFFDNVFVPAENRIGGEDGSTKVVMETFNRGRPMIGARGVGLAQGAIDHAIAFISTRVTFGQKVSDYQGVRWMVADMAMQTEAARQLVYHAAALADSGAKGMELAPVASMAKCFATDVAMQVASDAAQLFGAAAISAEYPINRYLRDAKVLQIIEGTNQIQRNIIANGVMGRVSR